MSIESQNKLLTTDNNRDNLVRSKYNEAIRFPFRNKPERFMDLNERLKEPFKIAVPKSKGEFANGIMSWAQSYGFDYTNSSSRQLSYQNANGSQLFLDRSSDIISALARGYVDYGVLGAEKIFELQDIRPYLLPVQPLCFGESLLCLGFRNTEYPVFISPKELGNFIKTQTDKGKKICTSLPRLLESALRSYTSSICGANIYYKSGSVESGLDMLPDDVFAIADIVGSGSTCMENNIRADYRLINIPGAFIARYDIEQENEIEEFMRERA